MAWRYVYKYPRLTSWFCKVELHPTHKFKEDIIKIFVTSEYSENINYNFFLQYLYLFVSQPLYIRFLEPENTVWCAFCLGF